MRDMAAALEETLALCAFPSCAARRTACRRGCGHPGFTPGLLPPPSNAARARQTASRLSSRAESHREGTHVFRLRESHEKQQPAAIMPSAARRLSEFRSQDRATYDVVYGS